MSDETTGTDGYPVCMCAMLAHQHVEGCPVKGTIDRLQQRAAELEAALRQCLVEAGSAYAEIPIGRIVAKALEQTDGR